MKERKKLYKAGKLWVTTTLVAFAGIVVTTTSASADDNTVVATPQTSQVNSSEPAPPTSAANQHRYACRRSFGHAKHACSAGQHDS